MSNVINKSRYSRRAFLGILGAGLTSSLLAGHRKVKVTRPNIIFLLTDDQRAGTLGASGHPFIKTPNLDKLTSDGVRFSNAFIAEPVCSPSRVSLFTGQYERVHGIGFSSSYDLSEKQWENTYPALLQKDGYYTGFVGKFGVEYYAFRGNAKSKFDFWKARDGWARFFPKGKGKGAIYNDCKEEIITPITGECIDQFLDSTPGEKPFCLSVSFSAPHGCISGSMFPGESGNTRMTNPANENPKLKDHPVYGNLYRNKDVKIPDECAGDPYKHIPIEVLDQDDGRNITYSYNYDRDTCLEHHFRYYQLITGIDKAVGQLRASLKKRGLSDNTIIIYSSDHGLLMGEYGMGGKALLYDLATKIPLIIYDPRLPKNKKGKVADELVSSIDITSTILKYAGAEVPAAMQGKSLVDLVNNRDIPWRDYIFLESLFIWRGNPFIEGVRTKDWKYLRYFKFEGKSSGDHYRDHYLEKDADFAGKEPVFEQLFNLKNDPTEKTNLIDNPEYNDILENLRGKCKNESQKMVNIRKRMDKKNKRES
jgi:arylsulfatase A-like enzyme